MFTDEQRQRACLQMSMRDCQDNLLDFYAFVAYTSDCHGWENVVIETPQTIPEKPQLALVG